MSFADRSALVGFGFNPLNRLSEKRTDAAFIDARRMASSARFLVFVGDAPLLHVDGERYAPFFDSTELALLGPMVATIFLGEDAEGISVFAVEVLPNANADAIREASVVEIGAHPGDAAPLVLPPGLERIDLRSIASRGLTTTALLGELGCAKSVLSWHQRHRFCANCGAPSTVSAGGWRRDCAACGTQHFPRVDPVVIMLAIDGERCLLGRSPHFAPGMYSALAGFLEPGETVEDAVRREIHEEAGVSCDEVRYFASQPWPFPASLMIACFATARSVELAIDTNELEDARWFTRAEVATMLAGEHPAGLSAPKPFAIAHHLLRAFAEGTGKPSEALPI